MKLNIETKLDVGQTVFWLKNNRIGKVTVGKVEIEFLQRHGYEDRLNIRYTISSDFYEDEITINEADNLLFSSKEELVASLLKDNR